MVEKNITLYDGPGYDFWKNFLLDSSIPEYKILGENYVLADDWDHYHYFAEYHVIGAGTHGLMTPSLSPQELKLGKNKAVNSGRGWYRSKEKVAGMFPFGGYLTNKKWHLNEVNEKKFKVQKPIKTNLIQGICKNFIMFPTSN